MKVVVTGAGGFIGYHVCKVFFETGHLVIGWDIVKKDSPWEMKYVNMQNIGDVRVNLEMDMPDIIIHCAGCADVGMSLQMPQKDFEGNVLITHHLFFALHELGRDDARVIFMSSAGIYGNPEKLPITEGAKRKPLSPYALHKAMCEDICMYFYTNYGMDVKILRVFSAYGKGLKKQIFWDMFKKSKKTGRLDMYGTGEESRDYIYITDLINAIYLVAKKAPKEEVIYNIANGEEVTIRQAAECFADAIGMDRGQIAFSGENKEGNPINWCADIEKLLRLGYKKSVNMKEGLIQYVDWVEEQECH